MLTDSTEYKLKYNLTSLSINICVCSMYNSFEMFAIYAYIFLNPILTGLFESKFFRGGGGGGVNLTPLSDPGPKGADRRELLHGYQDTCKEYYYDLFLVENGLFIMLL